MDGISGPSFSNLSPQLDSQSRDQDSGFFAPTPHIDTTPISQAPVSLQVQYVAPVAFTEPEPQEEPVTQEIVQDEPVLEPTGPEPVEPVPTPEAESSRVSYHDAQIQEVDITKVVPNPFQPRKTFDQAALEDLAASIRQHGVIQPIVLTETETGYELVAGERRFRASILAGLARVPAIVKKTMHDQTKLEVALIENIQRQELNPIEEAQAYDRLIKTFNLTQDQVAKKLGKSRPAITNTLRLLNLPAEIQRAVIEGRITEGHARALLGLVDIEKQLAMFQQVVEQGWNVRQVEAKVRELSVRRQMDAAAPDPKLMAIETELRGKLGTQVKIQRQGRGGKIMIEFFSDEELSDIIARMAEKQEQESSGYFTV